MIKKLTPLFLVLVLAFISIGNVFAEETVPKTSYELWTQAPTKTSMTDEEIRIQKAMELNLFYLYKLPQLGENYYLGICEGQMRDGGYNGNKDTSYYYYYTLLATDDGFIILGSESTSNEYYWEREQSFRDISSEIDESFYTKNGSSMPCYLISPNGKYGNSNYTEYKEYFIVTKDGKLYKYCADDDYSTAGIMTIKDKKLYLSYERYRSGSRTYYYYMSDGSTYATLLSEMLFKNNSIVMQNNTKVVKATVTAANGYSIYNEGFAGNASAEKFYKVAGTDNLFFKCSQILTYNSTDSRNYYYQKYEVYRKTGSNLSLVSTKTIPTQNTYAVTLTPKSINNLDETAYTSRGFSPPVALINNVVILKNGMVCQISLDRSIYTSFNYITYNNKLAVTRIMDGTSYIYHTDPETTSTYRIYWQKVNCLYFNNSGNTIMEGDAELKANGTLTTGMNGGYTYYSQFTASSDLVDIKYSKTYEWWGRKMTNVFPDGRYVYGDWSGMGGGLYQLWYNIYYPDGRLRSTGPTGYSTASSSIFDVYDLMAFAINDSKFIVTLSNINKQWAKEYYRVAVVDENDNGEIIGGGQLGEKNITAPDTADTEVVQNKIDFAQDDLPIGYNIKNNVIDSGKLDSSLRQQVNTIRLNDIVILKKSGYISGSQNTGTSLTYYSTYDYSMGSSYIRLYTNGQNFNWYCYSPENLTAGIYNKTIYSGDKTICVTIKVIAPPESSGVTSVTF